MKKIFLIAMLFLTACEARKEDQKCATVFTHEFGLMSCHGNGGQLHCNGAGCFATDCTNLMLGLKHINLRLDGNVIFQEKDSCEE